ncbi:hypothetical protein D9613_006282 [Agrocybe pediades]|uniref:GST N-terminal domain-containing protein n=1 Tax=Agrocybe pediades TaxID=84607 RepID=A0A8H4QU97_9AGAR|nr:hypothetical protein D9613_006282 [Agrocybe pediades]
MTIIFYDIPSDRVGAWSPNTWKTRFCLNFKGIPYKTEWVEYPDIAELSKKLGFKPTGKTPWDGTDYYSLPAIHDPSTGAYISDSWEIAEYLEKQYPDTPTLFPNGTKGLQAAIADGYHVALGSLWAFILPATNEILNSKSQGYFSRTRQLAFKVEKIQDLVPKGEKAVEEWGKLQSSLDKVDRWYAKTDDKGPFILGETISWSDLNIASWTIWMKVTFGEDSKEWKDIASWQGGRWSKLLVDLEKYSAKKD